MSVMADFQARQIIQRMHRVRNEVELFATHARTLRLSSSSIDGLVLLQEADNLLRGLKASRDEFANADAQVASASRKLSPFSPRAGGPPPAAQWGSEFRAASKQFIAAVKSAEKEIGQLYGAANAQLNSPTRTATAPDNIVDVLLTFIDALSGWIEYRRRQKQ
jgi:hypothetical protein